MYAAIDIGSNTILLLVAKLNNGGLQKIAEKRETPRLGKGMDDHRRLSGDAMNRAVNIVKQFRDYVYEKYSEEIPIIVTGTSAIREAVNSSELVRRINKTTGLRLRVIQGEEEAKLTFKGALSTLSLHNRGSSRFVVDIGGGSTELIYGTSQQIKKLHSFPMGSVRFSEQFLHSKLPSAEELQDCRRQIYKELQKVPFNLSPTVDSLIGVEGTITALAHIWKGIPGQYNAELLNGTILTADQIRSSVRDIASVRNTELLKQYPRVMRGRADVFLGGILILEALLHSYNLNRVIVSTGGIRQGAMLSYLT